MRIKLANLLTLLWPCQTLLLLAVALDTNGSFALSALNASALLNPFVYECEHTVFEFRALRDAPSTPVVTRDGLARLKTLMINAVWDALRQPGVIPRDRVPGDEVWYDDDSSGDSLDIEGNASGRLYLTWAVLLLLDRAFDAYLRRWAIVEHARVILVKVYDETTHADRTVAYIRSNIRNDQELTIAGSKTFAA